MNKRTLVAAGVAATMLVPTMANAEQDRVSVSEKGSLLIFSDVEVVIGDAGAVVRDTFISLTNDFNQDVRVQMYFIRQQGSQWVWTDNEITLTANQPIFWSAHTGNPAGGGVGSGNVSPWTGLGGSVADDMPFGNGGDAYRGYILAWAVDFDNLPIRWNHLSGSAMQVDYRNGYAWEYGAWASQVSSDFDHGAAVAQDGTLELDGATYAQPYNELLLNFYAPGSPLFSSLFGAPALVVDTRLTLHLVDADLRMNGASDADTKAAINVWNMNETKFSNTSRCISCWDTELLSDYTNTASVPNNFLLHNIQTRAGKARINGTQDGSCGGSSARALLGVSAKYIVAGAIRGDGSYAAAGSNLIGMGVEDATIQYDALAGGPDEGPGQIIDAARGARRGK